MYACVGKWGLLMSLRTKRTFSLRCKLWILPKNSFLRVSSETADSPYFGHARRYSADIVTAPENLNKFAQRARKFSPYLTTIHRVLVDKAIPSYLLQKRDQDGIQRKFQWQFFLWLHNSLNLCSRVPMENSFWCYFRQSLYLSFKKAQKL